MAIQIVFHPNHIGASDGDDQLDTVLRMVAWANSSPEVRENQMVDKYGIELETDLLLMHPFCWCEKTGECPWCTGCGHYQDNGLCQACRESYPHAQTCYQTELNDARKAAGLPHSIDGRFVDESVKRSYDARHKLETEIYSKLCKKHGLDSKFGAAVHCDCGADQRMQRAIEQRGCDYVKGRGLFARFAPYQHLRDRHYYDPPNFWYKPLDFRVRWYKYIGRDTATNRPLREGELDQIVRDCVPNPVKAYRAISDAGRERSEAMNCASHGKPRSYAAFRSFSIT